MALSQFFCAYYLDRFATLNSVINSGLFWLVVGTISCASFGYWINDYYDQERDIQNKKRPSYIAKLAPITVYIHLIIFVFVAFFEFVCIYYLASIIWRRKLHHDIRSRRANVDIQNADTKRKDQCK